MLVSPPCRVVRRAPPPSRKRVIKPRADLQEGIALTGKYLGLFVLFTSSMNWWYYKRIREEKEKDK